MKLIKQRLAGLFFLAVTVLCLWLTYHGQTPEDRDGTVILFTAPLGLYLLFTNKQVLRP